MFGLGLVKTPDSLKKKKNLGMWICKDQTRSAHLVLFFPIKIYRQYIVNPFLLKEINQMIHQPPHVTEKVEKLDLDFLDIKKKI